MERGGTNGRTKEAKEVGTNAGRRGGELKKKERKNTRCSRTYTNTHVLAVRFVSLHNCIFLFYIFNFN